MSFSIDANILLYASNRDSAVHDAAARFVQRCMMEADLFYLAWPTALAYLRISTHPGIFSSPLSPEEARQNIGALMQLPHVRFLSEGERFWPSFLSICEPLPVRGDLVPDAHLAAILREHGVTRLYSRDRDFRKFDFLTVLDPFEQ